jgi:hypothetical protein
MTNNSNVVLKILNIISWVVFIGLCIKAGALLTSYIISMNTDISPSLLYEKLDLSALKNHDVVAYSILFLSIVAVIVNQAMIFYTVILIFKKINMMTPFHEIIGNLIKKMAGYALVTGIFSIVTLAFAEVYIAKGFVFSNLMQYISQGDSFLFFAGILYFISLLFEKGISLQKESEFII